MIPSYFIAHGAPLLAIETNEYTQFLKDLGRSIPRPQAIVLFSAHWESTIQHVSDVDQYSTIYDFGGFPEALYTIQYPAIGKSSITKEIEELFHTQGVPFKKETNRGLDHGAWVVLRELYPNADIPVIAMSVNPTLSPKEQFKIGQSLSSLREKDVLIIGSGGTVHNLRALKWEDNGEVETWALAFDEWLEKHLTNWDTESLFDYYSLAPTADMAVPAYAKEHFVPIFYAMGAANNEPKATLLHRSYRYGTLSHSVWQFG
ncbi:DODA-type extradiol aromatic ring-opening family dioxygenase [Bacillus massiliigorillae]|uniref:DODA-type extradiol aromatic ring-opening family dioxygenase n=1 Tax=Bacillus massiliigorillae TaxID=1243664 RepID=UPI0003AAC79E|nr:class III extradiol ring-cleavage dioxygenase [Bacillus massiliigorillae]